VPLIRSPRHSPEDLEHWQRMARLDWLRGQRKDWPRREAKALQVIRDFRPDYCGVSWGKDSVVVAHLCRRVDPEIPLVYMIDGEWENPDCRLVRDAFLADYPGAYFEYVTPPQLQTAPDGRVWPGAASSTGTGCAPRHSGASAAPSWADRSTRSTTTTTRCPG